MSSSHLSLGLPIGSLPFNFLIIFYNWQNFFINKQINTFWAVTKNLEMSKQIVWTLHILLVTLFIVSIFIRNLFQSSTKYCILVSKAAHLSPLRIVLHRLLHYLLGSSRSLSLSQGNIPEWNSVKKIKDNEAFPARSTSFLFPLWLLSPGNEGLSRETYSQLDGNTSEGDAGHVDTRDIDTWLHGRNRHTHTHRVRKSCVRKYYGEITNNLPTFII
jgi:hypothetical protein